MSKPPQPPTATLFPYTTLFRSNMLKNEFELFYIAGVRLNWGLGNLYTTKKERELLQVNQRMVEVQKELFMLNTNTQLKQQQDRKSTRLSSSHSQISYAVFCLKK